jgi:glycine betaine/choline ABC-type transport system substrate-binding protein
MVDRQAVNIHGGNQVAVGDNAHAENFTQNSTLSHELGTLKTELTKRAQTPEQLNAARCIEEAEQASKNGDEQTALQKIKAAGTWALEVATEIGTDIAAKMISKQLGL